MLHFWAGNEFLLCLAFLLPSVVNCIAAVVFVYVASRRLLYRVIAIVVWLAVLIGALLLMLWLFSEAMMIERATVLNIVCVLWAAWCIELFHKTFGLISWALPSNDFRSNDEWDDDSDDDNWDDDDPDPLLPAPMGPSAGRILTDMLLTFIVVCIIIPFLGLSYD